MSNRQVDNFFCLFFGLHPIIKNILFLWYKMYCFFVQWLFFRFRADEMTGVFRMLHAKRVFGLILLINVNLNKIDKSLEMLGSWNVTCSGRYAPGPGFLVPSEGNSFLAVIEYCGCFCLYVDASVTLYVPGPGA